MAADQVQEILIALAEIKSKLDAALAQGIDHEARLRSLEGKSGKRWDGLISQIISVVIAAVIGGFIGHFIK
ncbi:MAG: hypothetical protein AAGU75_10995 [Bacillota bacterium]